MIPLGTLGGDHVISRAWLLTLVTRIPVGVPPGTVRKNTLHGIHYVRCMVAGLSYPNLSDNSSRK